MSQQHEIGNAKNVANLQTLNHKIRYFACT